MNVGKFKARFSEVIEWVKKGNMVAVTYGKNKEIVGYFIPELPTSDEKRQLGILKGKATVHFEDDFKITEDEFLRPPCSWGI